MLTVFLIWAGVVVYCAIGISLLLILYYKTPLFDNGNKGKTLFEGFLQIAKRMDKDFPENWSTDWFSLFVTVMLVLAWPITIIIEAIITFIIRLRTSKH